MRRSSYYTCVVFNFVLFPCDELCYSIISTAMTKHAHFVRDFRTRLLTVIIRYPLTMARCARMYISKFIHFS